MATKRLYIDGTSGVFMIGDYDTSLNAVADPQSYLAKLNFHSSLPYLKIVSSISINQLNYAALPRELAVLNDGSKSGCF